jgi:bacterial/archaeal transporter family-2 protein
MSAGSALAVVLSLAAGLGGSVQAAVMGKLGDRVGIFGAVAFSTLVSAVIGITALLVVRQSFGGIGAAARQPIWLWTGGMLSAFIILAITVGPPRIGVAATIALVIAGNLAMAAVIDRFGLFGGKSIPLNWPRLLGIALLAAGAALTLKK